MINWIIGIVAALFAALSAIAGLFKKQRNNARKEAEINQQNYEEAQALNDVNHQINETLRKSREEAQEHESQIDTSNRPGPDDEFNDSRLRSK